MIQSREWSLASASHRRTKRHDPTSIPADAAELLRIFERLGALSRFRRFLMPLNRLSKRQIEYLARIDHTNHEALIAFDAQTGDGVGVARYLRNPRDPPSPATAPRDASDPRWRWTRVPEPCS
jgi:hypothetical protein